ncbi:hypothetical protein [Rhizobium oryzicola]|uniref:Uncharacterized protein n=1 Tax=Rhizobium oryzicola TaxID=1232668 RepID=A0ABT8T1G1_9HYPH|nr:hypothetical protein [Rhizobium oryzicola]MDO1584486.1 hypothetical protein [Rhizobium oryzicola]
MPPFSVLIASMVVLVAAPGEAPPTRADLSQRVEQALARRLDIMPLATRITHVGENRNKSGFTVCGYADERAGTARKGQTERFFVVVPGNFAILDRDGADLMDDYWRNAGC